MQHRDVEAALVAHQQRPVIGNEFGEQADDEQHEKDPQRPEAAPVGAEIVEPTPGQRSGLDAPNEAAGYRASDRSGMRELTRDKTR